MSSGKSPGEELPEDLKTIETALRQLTPAVTQIDRDRLMYLAGQASVMVSDFPYTATSLARGQTFAKRNLWPMATAALALISVTLGGLLLQASRPGSPVVFVELPPVGNEDRPLAAWADEGFAHPPTQARDQVPNYLQLRNFVLTHGNGALPATPAVNNLNPPAPQPPLPTLQRQWFGQEF